MSYKTGILPVFFCGTKPLCVAPLCMTENERGDAPLEPPKGRLAPPLPLGQSQLLGGKAIAFVIRFIAIAHLHLGLSDRPSNQRAKEPSTSRPTVLDAITPISTPRPSALRK